MSATAEAQDRPATELQVAEAIASGQMTSPQQVGASSYWVNRAGFAGGSDP